jgi:hypothetical protein
MVKDKVRMYQAQRRELPEMVVVKLVELEEKVRFILLQFGSMFTNKLQGKGT